ncbi:hypothetical protein [Arthrospiribacter ruber]|uniref:CRISPR-associated protein Cas5 n=1 Tax=Arthrospiribacter ruber TaxID=2487934 RepID=A0A951MIS3_9BACT|nr:hypothetical protein [Arthrospiribacter ruber]MBW3470440.1 hypothetical protein [Arthrospiribacter ruber]
MDKVLEIRFSGWTATPRMPFVLSGNAVCMPVPSYSLLLGLIGCCLGRLVSGTEVKIGFNYSYDSVGKDLETRQRLEYDGKKVKAHSKGTDAYLREFHVAPKLTLWLDRSDWETYFLNPVGTPSLGRSQDILKIESVGIVEIKSVTEATISGCMVPFSSDLKAGGQLFQLAEAYQESEEVGGGRKAINTRIFMAIPPDNEANMKIQNLYQTQEGDNQSFYLHHF